MKNGEPVIVDTVCADPRIFSDGCVALLGLDAITQLGIDINYHIRHEKHVQLKFLASTKNNELCKRIKTKMIEKYSKEQQLERYLHHVTFLSERICAEYLKENPSDYVAKRVEQSTIAISPKVPPETRAKILQLLLDYQDVFAKMTNSLPKTMAGVKPHVFKLIEGFKPTTVGRPRFGPAQAKNQRLGDMGEQSRPYRTGRTHFLVLAPNPSAKVQTHYTQDLAARWHTCSMGRHPS